MHGVASFFADHNREGKPMIRRSVRWGLIAAAVLGASPANTQTYPAKPVTIVVAAAAGGVTDLLGRLVADFIARKSGQQVIVENRSGAGGNIGMDAVAKAAPDGYTLGLASSGNIVINPFIFKRMPFDALKDLVPVAPLAEAPQMIAIHAGMPAKTLREFIALAKAKPGSLTYASAGKGTTMHFAADQFARLAGISMIHVPYRGATPAVTDVAAGTVNMISVSIGPLRGALNAGKVRVLATATRKRLPYLPDVPTSAEAGVPGYEMTSWFGVVAPAGTPKPIIEQINGYVQEMLADPAAQKRMEASRLDAMRMNANEFADFVKADYARWERIVRDSGVEPN
jgi:tripartite-type tricarboxylate transporter receptor subunit TctC